jgi:hypothetical protein
MVPCIIDIQADEETWNDQTSNYKRQKASTTVGLTTTRVV